jgi:hypothetical protein
MIIELSSDSTKFRSTTIKSYYDDHVDLENSSLSISIIDLNSLIVASVSKSSNISSSNDQRQSNDQFVVSNQESEFEISSDSSKRDRDRSRKYLASTAYLSFVFSTTVDLALASISLFAAASKLDSITHIVLSQFAESRQKEINDLIEKDVFRSVSKNDVSSDVRIFNSRFVDEIKHFDTDKAFEKSRLVVQTFNDQNKNLMLTQSFTIQRISQRLFVCLIVVFSKMNLYLKDITQTYVQSITSLNRDFFVRPPVELIKHLGIDTDSILKIVKSLSECLNQSTIPVFFIQIWRSIHHLIFKQIWKTVIFVQIWAS